MIWPVLEFGSAIVLIAVIGVVILGLMALGFGVYLVIRVLRKLSRYLGWLP